MDARSRGGACELRLDRLTVRVESRHDLADDGDVRSMMRQIESLNAMDGGMLTAGQELVVPAG